MHRKTEKYGDKRCPLRCSFTYQRKRPPLRPSFFAVFTPFSNRTIKVLKLSLDTFWESITNSLRSGLSSIAKWNMFECFYEMLFCDQSTFYPFFLFFIFIFINVRLQSTFWNCFIHHSIAFIEIYSTISRAPLKKSSASCCTMTYDSDYPVIKKKYTFSYILHSSFFLIGKYHI